MLTVPSHLGLPPPLPMLMGSPNVVMASTSFGVSPSGAAMNTCYGSPVGSSFSISNQAPLHVGLLSPPLPIMLDGSIQDSIIAGTFSGVSPSRATMTTYAASSPVVSPFANSNQQYEALRFTPMMQQQSILVVPRMEHDAFITSSTASTPLLAQTDITGVSRYLRYEDKDELNPFSDAGDFIDCLRDTDDDGTQGPRADDDGPQLASSILDVHDSTPSNIVSQQSSEGRDEEKKSSSVRINPKYLRIHADQMHKDQPSLCNSAEEAMYRRGQASVLENETTVCRTYRLFQGFMFGDQDLEGEVRKTRSRESPFRGFEAIIANVIKMENALGYDVLHRINRRQGCTRLQIICASHASPINCMFFIEAKDHVSTVKGKCARITSSYPYHKCQVPAAKDLLKQLQEGSSHGGSISTGVESDLAYKRVRNISMQRLTNCSQSLSMRRKEADRRKCRTSAPRIMDDFHRELQSTSISATQVMRFTRTLNNDSYKAEALDLCLLPDLFRKLKATDPLGTYIVNVKPLSYDVKEGNKVVVPAGSAQEFASYMYIPSYAKMFYDHSCKIISIDGAHVYRKFKGILLIAVGKDAELSNVMLGHALVPQENKHYWQLFVMHIREACPNIEFLMSDKAKGLFWYNAVIKLAYFNLIIV